MLKIIIQILVLGFVIYAVISNWEIFMLLMIAIFAVAIFPFSLCVSELGKIYDKVGKKDFLN